MLHSLRFDFAYYKLIVTLKFLKTIFLIFSGNIQTSQYASTEINKIKDNALAWSLVSAAVFLFVVIVFAAICRSKKGGGQQLIKCCQKERDMLSTGKTFKLDTVYLIVFLF